MRNKLLRVILIFVILIVVILIDFPVLLDIKENIFKRKIEPVLGLDLRGGMQVVLQAPEGYTIDQETLQVASTILENRSNALGVSEVVFQVAGNDYIVGEFPGLENITEVIAVIKQTGMLEFVDVGNTIIAPGTEIQTDYLLVGQPSIDSASTASSPANSVQTEAISDVPVFNTVITGADLASVVVTPPRNPGDGYAVAFTLKPDAKKIFGDFTKANVGKMLAIVLDKKIVSTPVIRQAIETGEGAISGQGENAYTFEEANNLRITLFYGTLPVALEIAESRVVGPTLGQASLQKSLVAAAIGFVLVSLFMLIYYRAPGFVAIVSILIFGLITYAVYLLIPVTLTLPGIAGFLLSVGSALDANILQFERIKEELRKGRTLSQAVDLGWSRAWPSIRDSNLAAIITSGILFWFGSTFGATIVKGFALTLALGVVISLFTALFVTRTLLNLGIKNLEKADKRRWFGI